MVSVYTSFALGAANCFSYDNESDYNELINLLISLYII